MLQRHHGSGEEREKQTALDNAMNPIVTQQRIVVQNYHLFWFDTNVNECNEDFLQSLVQLKRLVNTIDTFSNVLSCIDFLRQVQDEQVLMIISSSWEEHLVHRVHDIPCLKAIYMFSAHSSSHSKAWTKVKGEWNTFASLRLAVQQTVRQCEQDSIQISMLAAHEVAEKNLDELDPSFMYSQLLKEILLEIDAEDDARALEELIDYCRHLYVDNPSELEKVNQLEREYNLHSPIW